MAKKKKARRMLDPMKCSRCHYTTTNNIDKESQMNDMCVHILEQKDIESHSKLSATCTTRISHTDLGVTKCCYCFQSFPNEKGMSRSLSTHLFHCQKQNSNAVANRSMDFVRNDPQSEAFKKLTRNHVRIPNVPYQAAKEYMEREYQSQDFSSLDVNDEDNISYCLPTHQHYNLSTSRFTSHSHSIYNQPLHSEILDCNSIGSSSDDSRYSFSTNHESYSSLEEHDNDTSASFSDDNSDNILDSFVALEVSELQQNSDDLSYEDEEKYDEVLEDVADDARQENFSDCSENDDLSDEETDYEDGSKPSLIPPHVCGGDGNDSEPDRLIQTYMREIRKHRARVGLEQDYIPYAILLHKLTRPGIPENLYDNLMKDISSNWKLKERTVNFPKNPTRIVMKKWLMDVVHPKEYHRLAMPKKVVCNLRDGRSVPMTVFDLRYQIALLLSDVTLYQPKNFIFPNKNDPFEEPDYDNTPLGDINTGLFHQITYEMLRTCKDPAKRLFLFSILEFIDATNVKRNSVEPGSACIGMFNASTRNLDRSWICFGYVEPAANIVGRVRSDLLSGKKKNKVTQDVKLNAYHEMLGCIHADLVDLQRTGFMLDIPLETIDKTTGKYDVMEVLAVPVLQAVLSDTKAGNAFCGRYGNHGVNVKGLCRDCDVPTLNAADHDHRCEYFEKDHFNSLTAEEKKQLSFYNIQNSFDKIWFGFCDRYGVYGATPPELLHVFYLGICEYLFDGFMETLSIGMKQELHKLSKSMVQQISLSRDVDLPNVDCYRHGITYANLMITGKEKLARIFVLYLCLQNTTFVDHLSKSKKRKTSSTKGYEYTLKKVKSWFELMERTLGFDRWLREDSHERSYFFTGEDIAPNEPIAQTVVRDYMRLFKETVQRTKGTKLLLTKFHHLLHFVHYTRIHGRMSNFDGSRPESHGKSMTKDPGLRTNHQVSRLTLNIGIKLAEDRCLKYFFMYLCHYQPLLAAKYEIDDAWSPEVREQQKKHEISILEEDDVKPVMKGSRFCLVYDQNYLGGSMIVQWRTRTTYTHVWDDRILTTMESLLFPQGYHDDIVEKEGYNGFTEMKMLDYTNKKMVTYRAHPCYKNRRPWHSWVFIKWEDLDDVYPAKVFMFLKVPSVVEAGSIFFDLSGSVAIIQSSVTGEQKRSRKEKIVGTLNTRYLMENKLSAVHVDSINGMANVVEDSYFEDPSVGNLCEYISVIRSPKEFMKEAFYGSL